MWKTFKESVWDFLLGKVVSVLGILGTAQTLISLFKPDYVITITNTVRIDYRIWFVFTLLLLVGIILRVLHTANHYKRLSEVKDKIGIVYNEKYYPACRQERGKEEVIRVGIRVIGKVAVENLEVFPSHLELISKIKNKRRKINRFALSPMHPDMLSRPVNPGTIPTCFVDLLRHKLGTRKVAFCYRDYPNEYLSLSVGKYELNISARGRSNQHGFKTLFISLDTQNVLTVKPAKGDEI